MANLIRIDPARTQAAADAAIRGGRETYQQQVGPEWRGRLRAMKQVLDYCREIGLDPSALSWHGETGAGNARPPEEQNATTPQEAAQPTDG